MTVAVNGDSQFVGPAGSTATTLAVTIFIYRFKVFFNAMMALCWDSVADVGPVLDQGWDRGPVSPTDLTL